MRVGLPEQAMGCLPFIGLGLVAEGKPISTEFSCSIHVHVYYNNNYYVHSLVCWATYVIYLPCSSCTHTYSLSRSIFSFLSHHYSTDGGGERAWPPQVWAGDAERWRKQQGEGGPPEKTEGVGMEGTHPTKDKEELRRRWYVSGKQLTVKRQISAWDLFMQIMWV